MNATPWLHPKPPRGEPHVGSIVPLPVGGCLFMKCRVESVRHFPGQPRPLWRVRSLGTLQSEFWTADFKTFQPVIRGAHS